jgi:hypothetical protein
MRLFFVLFKTLSSDLTCASNVPDDMLADIDFYKKLARAAKMVWFTFVCTGSPSEINLPSNIKMDITRVLGPLLMKSAHSNGISTTRARTSSRAIEVEVAGGGRRKSVSSHKSDDVRCLCCSLFLFIFIVNQHQRHVRSEYFVGQPGSVDNMLMFLSDCVVFWNCVSPLCFPTVPSTRQYRPHRHGEVDSCV